MQHDELKKAKSTPKKDTSTSSSLTRFAKKSLGQNFLKSERALSDMIEAGDIQPGETIIEIGPGKGALTSKLLAKIKELNSTSKDSSAKQIKKTRLVCIEKDDRLIPFLKEEYKKDIEDGVLEVLHGDIIEILNNKEKIEEILQQGTRKEKIAPYKIIANIPYYITGLIFRGIFELDHLPSKIVMLVQKEVANRIMAYGDNGEKNAPNSKGLGKESILSISVKLYGTPRRVSIVPKGAFVPAPAVDSAIIVVENISRKIPKNLDKKFFDMIHSAFSHKRKRLAKNLKSFKSKDYEQILVSLGLDKDVRAEDISIETYIQLFERLVY
jgi:16S rRNA (adenine1518-N6/adenine1519-N6)-dimethyltransferase